jgi:hypothetical protein
VILIACDPSGSVALTRQSPPSAVPLTSHHSRHTGVRKEDFVPPFRCEAFFPCARATRMRPYQDPTVGTPGCDFRARLVVCSIRPLFATGGTLCPAPSQLTREISSWDRS